ncbi:MAG: hypothetical protein ABJA80_06810 [bacterium]
MSARRSAGVRALLLVALVLPLAAVPAAAQGGLRNPAAAARRAERQRQQQERQQERQQEKQQEKLQPEKQQPGAAAGQPARVQQLQQQVRRSLWRAAKQRVGFSDEQMTQLEQTSSRFDQQRRQLAQEERAQRVAMRSQILADSGANQAVIAASMDRLHALQQRRLDLQAEEQKEFATFMTPLQRAKFTALQDQVRRRLQAFARAHPDSTAGQAIPPQ